MYALVGESDFLFTYKTSATDTSGSASIGAAKNPLTTHRAIHCPLPLAYGDHIVMARVPAVEIK
jgi:hypothetical protein